MASTPKSPAADTDDDPVYTLDQAEVFRRLFGGTRTELHWRPVRRRRDCTEIERRSSSTTPVRVAIDLTHLRSLETPDFGTSREKADDLGIWIPPVGESRLAIDREIDDLIASKYIVATGPGRYTPHYVVRLYIADAAEAASRHLRAHSAVLRLKTFIDALQTVEETVCDPQAIELVANTLGTDFDRPPPRHFRSVRSHEQEDRERALAVDLEAAMMALRPARPMMERIAARASTVMAHAHPKGRHPEFWKHVFATEMTRAWRVLVQDDHKQPAQNEGSKYQKFIVAAYKSLGGTRSNRFLGAVKRLRASGDLEPEPLSETVNEAAPPKLTALKP